MCSKIDGTQASGKIIQANRRAVVFGHSHYNSLISPKSYKHVSRENAETVPMYLKVVEKSMIHEQKR